MKASYWQRGEALDYVNAAETKIEAGTVLTIGKRIGIAGTDINFTPAIEQYEAAGSERRYVTVALIDTGVDIGHPELSEAIWINGDEIPGDGIDNDGNLTYVLLGDGESEEGQIWEAAMFCAHHKIDNLIAITDWNRQQIDGNVDSVGGLGDLESKWKSFGWEVISCDGHDFGAILSAFGKAKGLTGKGKPVMLLMNTEMGHGVDFMAGTCEWHGKAPSEELAEKALAQIEETLGDY